MWDSEASRRIFANVSVGFVSEGSVGFGVVSIHESDEQRVSVTVR